MVKCVRRGCTAARPQQRQRGRDVHLCAAADSGRDRTERDPGQETGCSRPNPVVRCERQGHVRHAATPRHRLHPRLAETVLGPIEYAVVGTGVPVLVVHGSPGGIDAVALMAGFLPREKISAILVSRPGYLGTELGNRTTADRQADLLAALLEHLGIDRAGVFSWSGGGPSAYRLAVRHPERVSTLVAFAAVSQAYQLPKTELATRLMFTTGGGRWLLRLLAAQQPEQYIAGALAGEGNLTNKQLDRRVKEVFADPVKRGFVPASRPVAQAQSPGPAAAAAHASPYSVTTRLPLSDCRGRSSG
jgi:pimeloyl-ACP methyl ester carboxylesterase